MPLRQSQDTLFNQIYVHPESGPVRIASVGTRSTLCVQVLPAPGQVVFDLMYVSLHELFMLRYC